LKFIGKVIYSEKKTLIVSLCNGVTDKCVSDIIILFWIPFIRTPVCSGKNTNFYGLT
jgi:hypothetical protein